MSPVSTTSGVCQRGRGRKKRRLYVVISARRWSLDGSVFPLCGAVSSAESWPASPSDSPLSHATNRDAYPNSDLCSSVSAFLLRQLVSFQCRIRSLTNRSGYHIDVLLVDTFVFKRLHSLSTFVAAVPAGRDGNLDPRFFLSGVLELFCLDSIKKSMPSLLSAVWARLFPFRQPALSPTARLD